MLATMLLDLIESFRAKFCLSESLMYFKPHMSHNRIDIVNVNWTKIIIIQVSHIEITIGIMISSSITIALAWHSWINIVQVSHKGINVTKWVKKVLM